jgi:hypothetical protein
MDVSRNPHEISDNLTVKTPFKSDFNPSIWKSSLDTFLSGDMDRNQNFHASDYLSDNLSIKPVPILPIRKSFFDDIHPHLRGVLMLIEKDIGREKLEKRLLKYSIGNEPEYRNKKNSPLELAKQLSFDTDRNSYEIENMKPDTKVVEKDTGPKFIHFRNIMNSTNVEHQHTDFNDPKISVNVVKGDEQNIKAQGHASCPKCNGKINNSNVKAKAGHMQALQSIPKERM